MVAVPEVAGVQRKTRSGDVSLLAQVPARALAPLVAPVKVPPAAGIVTGEAHVPAGGVVVVVVGASVVVVVVVLVLAPLGGVTLSENAPLRPAYPSTMMKYGVPACTVGVRREPWAGPDAVAHPVVSSFQASSGPLPHTPWRTYATVS
jgi:hypothetical protein